MKTPTILEDDREIRSIWTDNMRGWMIGDSSGSAAVCTKIVAYHEPGQCAYVPWFAVYDGDQIVCRVPSHRCEEVWYK